MDREVRARVIKVEGSIATLGIYMEGVWHRIKARTEVRLCEGDWIRGHLIVPPDGSMLVFKLDEVERRAATEPEEIHPSQGGLDLEA